jgi:hypothetical protein
VVVELSQPEVCFVPPRRPGGACPKEQAPCAAKAPFINIHKTKIKNKLFGGAGGVSGAGRELVPITTVTPAFATATIPIAFQTTRFAAVGAELGLAGAVRRESAELSRADIEEAVREALRGEAAAQREVAAKRETAQREAATQADACAELKDRVTRVEKRLEEVEKQVQGIITKLNKLP